MFARCKFEETLKFSEDDFKMTSEQFPDINILLIRTYEMFWREKQFPGVQQLRQLMLQHQLLPLQPLQRAAKDSGAWDLQMKVADRLYDQERYSQAIEWYTKAIASAPSNSKELAVGYSERSKVLFMLKKYSMCLLDISRALAINIEDQALREELIKRREACNCVNTASPNYQNVNPFQLSGATHENIPCASSKVTLTFDDKYSRKIVATEAIEPGEVIAVEKPHVTILKKNFYFHRCYNCCAECYTMIPCESCSLAMFCGEECRAASMKQYHRYECPIMNFLQADSFTTQNKSALRIAIKARLGFSSWDKFKDTVLAINNGFVDVNKVKTLDSQYYDSIHTLETNVNKMTKINLFISTARSAIILDLLANHTDFFSLYEDEEVILEFFGKLLLRNNLISEINLHSIYTTHQDVHENFASGIYAFSSLINHSCSKNVYRIFKGTSVILLSLRPIEKGGQIFVSYGPHYTSENKQSRQHKLRYQYKFVCDCEACVNNWPTYNNLPALANKMNHVMLCILSLARKLRVIGIFRMQWFESDKGLSCVLQEYFDLSSQLCKIIAIVDKYKPCKELIDFQDTIEHCWDFIVSKLSSFEGITSDLSKIT